MYLIKVTFWCDAFAIIVWDTFFTSHFSISVSSNIDVSNVSPSSPHTFVSFFRTRMKTHNRHWLLRTQVGRHLPVSVYIHMFLGSVNTDGSSGAELYPPLCPDLFMSHGLLHRFTVLTCCVTCFSSGLSGSWTYCFLWDNIKYFSLSSCYCRILILIH